VSDSHYDICLFICCSTIHFNLIYYYPLFRIVDLILLLPIVVAGIIVVRVGGWCIIATVPLFYHLMGCYTWALLVTHHITVQFDHHATRSDL